jgi:adenosylcobinamide-GDP ribazoletransferase
LAPATVAAAMAWAPAVGLLLGVIAAGVLLAVDHPLGAGPLTGRGARGGALALLSRGLHLDGLADLADGLGSGKPAAPRSTSCAAPTSGRSAPSRSS